MKTKLPKLKWLVIDGLPFHLLKRYVDPIKLPNLFQLVSNGSITALEPLWPNCQTPPSLFSIWSGKPALHHGILGYDTPTGATVGEFSNSFSFFPSECEMVWDTYARSDQKIRLVHIPFVREEKLGSNLIFRSAVYNQPGYKSEVFSDTQITVNGNHVYLSIEPLSDDEAMLVVVGDNTYVLQVIAKDNFVDIFLPHPLNHTLTVSLTDNIQGKPMGVLLGKNDYYCSGLLSKDFNTQENFCHEGLSKAYRNSELGEKRINGGKGQAEKVLIDSLEKVHNSFYKDLKFNFNKKDADLIVGYSPVIDLALHEILNIEFLAETDEKISSIFFKVLNWAEELVTMAISSCSENERLVINSDHGMQPIYKNLNLNRLLELNGFLCFDKHGKVDFKNTIVAYHPAENGTLMIRNDVENKHEIIKRIKSCFEREKIKDPIIISLDLNLYQQDFDVSWFIFPPDGIRLKASKRECVVEICDKAGDHCAFSNSKDLKGTFFTNFSKKIPEKMHVYDIKKTVLR